MLKLEKNILATFYFNLNSRLWMTNPFFTKIQISQVDFVDFILENSPLCSYKSDSLFTGLSECYKLVLSVLKRTFSKSKSEEIIYRNF